MIDRPIMTPRTLAAASCVRPGTYLIDVGCDHGYFGAALARIGFIKAPLFTDVNIGPLSRAKENIAELGVTDARFILTDGLTDVKVPDTRCDIAIMGMGGETVVKILSDSEAKVKKKNVSLILQPMTKADVLRKYLAENGFEIDTEIHVPEEKKCYVIMRARYTGNVTECGDMEALLGLFQPDVVYDGGKHLLEIKEAKTAAYEGKASVGKATEEEAEFLRVLGEEIDRRLELIKKYGKDLGGI